MSVMMLSAVHGVQLDRDQACFSSHPFSGKIKEEETLRSWVNGGERSPVSSPLKKHGWNVNPEAGLSIFKEAVDRRKFSKAFEILDYFYGIWGDQRLEDARGYFKAKLVEDGINPEDPLYKEGEDPIVNLLKKFEEFALTLRKANVEQRASQKTSS